MDWIGLAQDRDRWRTLVIFGPRRDEVTGGMEEIA